MNKKEEKRELRRLKWVFGTPYFVQGTSGLSEIPTLFFIKSVLEMSDSYGQLFQSLKSIGWFIKPLWGFISDSFPIFGYHRKSWFVLMACLSLVFWVSTAGLAFFGVTIPILYLIVFNLAFGTYAFVDVVTDAIMVEEGRRLKRVASFVNFQWTMLAISNAGVSFMSGWFQEQIAAGNLAYWMIFLLTGIFPLITAIVGLKNIKENRVVREPKARRNPRIKVSKEKIFRLLNALRNFPKDNRIMWLLILFIFFWKFTPSVGYIHNSYMIDVREFSGSIFGIIGGIGGITFLLSILTYTWIVNRVRRINWHHYLYAMVAIGIVSFPLSFFLYLEPDHPWWKFLMFTIPDYINPLPDWNRYAWFNLVTGTILGFATIPAFLIPLTIAGETVKLKYAGMSYAFLMAFSNVTNMFSGMVGAGLYGLFSQEIFSKVLDTFRGSWFDIAGVKDERTLILQLFVYISMFFTILSVLFVYLLKKEFVRQDIKIYLGRT